MFRNRLFRLDRHHPDVEKLAVWGEWFFRHAARNIRHEGHQLVISGPSGCGKTHVGKRIFQQLQVWAVDMSLTAGWKRQFPSSTFIDWSDLAEADDQDDFKEAERLIEESAIVFLDDVGAESDRFKNGVNSSRLRRFLASCERKWLLLTTNLTKPQFGLTYDLRVADRLCGAHWCDLKDLPSYRPRLHGRNVTAPTETHSGH